MEPQAILGMIGWQLHILNLVKAAGQMSADEIGSQAKISPFVVRKNQANVRRISDQKLLKLLKLAINTDKRLKSTSVNADDAVQALIVAF
jgi:DNA polymerase III delta subunit